MTTNNLPNVGYLSHGIDWNYYQQITVANTSFGSQSTDGYEPSLIITLPAPTCCVIMTNLSSSGTVQWSANGNTVHGQITGYSTTGVNQQIIYYNRVLSTIWFQVATGSCLVSVEAWAT